MPASATRFDQRVFHTNKEHVNENFPSISRIAVRHAVRWDALKIWSFAPSRRQWDVKKIASHLQAENGHIPERSRT